MIAIIYYNNATTYVKKKLKNSHQQHYENKYRLLALYHLLDYLVEYTLSGQIN